MPAASWHYLIIIAALSVTSVALAKPAVPVDTDVKAATTLVAEVYKKDYDAAKTPVQKQTLAQKMLADADKTADDLTSAYALYQVAQKIAVGIGDIETAMRISERLTARFDLDPAALERKLYESIAPAAKTPLDQANLTRYIGRALPALVAQGKFEDVGALLDVAVDAARKSKDGDLQKYWTWKETQLKAQASAWTKAKAALATLKSSPADAEASGVAGAYRAFWDEDWAAAIPLLALSDQQPWQQLAERELAGANTEADKLALADAWYDAAIKAPSPAKEAALRHAAAQYDSLVSSLTALTKRRVENRLSEIRDVASPFPKDTWVEILDLVNVNRHAIEGSWEREGLSIVYRDPNHCKHIYIPVLIEGAYELRIRAARFSNGDALTIPLSRTVNGCGFSLNAFKGTISGLQYVDGKGIPDNNSRVAPAPVVNGQPYLLTLQIEPKDEKVAITAYFNNRPYMRWSGERSRLRYDEHEFKRERLILGACHSTIAVYSVQFKRKSGPAWLTDPVLPTGVQQSPLDEAIALHERDIAELRTQMLAKFGEVAEKTSQDTSVAEADRAKMAARLQIERDAYEKAGYVPFSAYMRESVSGHIKQLNAADAQLRKVFDAEIADAVKKGQATEAEDLKAKRDTLLPRRELARWDAWVLYADGGVHHPQWHGNRWSLSGNRINLSGGDRWTLSHLGDTVSCVNRFNIRFGQTWRPPKE